MNIDGLKRLKFLETLFLGHNQLENLDKFLAFLNKYFAFLIYLDLQENPLAAEPYYRLRVIKALPNVRLLDQQMITIEEREKAAKLDMSVGASKAKASKKKKGVKSTMKGFSKVEKELYREVDQLKKTYKQQEEFEETKRQTMLNFTYVKPGQTPPTAHKVLENKEKFGQDVENRVTEWEKNIIKRLFKVYDVDKSGFLDISELKKLMKDLVDDKGIMGKVPKLSEEEIETLFDDWDKNKDNKISWEEFRNGLNSWEWKLMDKEEIQQRIDQFYEEAERKKAHGVKEALQVFYKVLALQGCETKTKPIEIKKQVPEEKLKRGDVFLIPHFRNDSEKAKEIKITAIKK